MRGQVNKFNGHSKNGVDDSGSSSSNNSKNKSMGYIDKLSDTTTITITWISYTTG